QPRQPRQRQQRALRTTPVARPGEHQKQSPQRGGSERKQGKPVGRARATEQLSERKEFESTGAGAATAAWTGRWTGRGPAAAKDTTGGDGGWGPAAGVGCWGEEEEDVGIGGLEEGLGRVMRWDWTWLDH